MLNFIGSALAIAVEAPLPRLHRPESYLQPQQGFETYIAAAIVKKHVPVVVTQSEDVATYKLSSCVQAKEESTGGKIMSCLFLYCAGMAGTQNASVQLVDAKIQEVVWAYNVRKADDAGLSKHCRSDREAPEAFLRRNPR